MTYCGMCERQQATHKTHDLPEVVQPDVWGIGEVCDDCYADLVDRAELLASS